MPATSIHQDILTLAKTRLAALSLGGTQNRIEEREILDPGWMQGVGACPLWVISGVGLRLPLPAEESTCEDWVGYPLLLRLVDRQPHWSIEARDTHMGYLQTVMNAFIRTPLTLTYTGAHCTDILLQPTNTIEAEPLAFQLISRPLLFQVNTVRTY